MNAIDITEYLEKFKEHITLNKRTILSAKFGDGKTYFLNKFREEYANEFYFITIYPVNYSVAENADIFEYIKRDIIVQLASDDILSNIDFTSIVDTLFSWENTKEVISFLLSFIPAGRFYDKLLSKGKDFYDKYEEKKTTYKKYFTYFENQKGGLYEHDAYTKLIENAIEYIQNNKRQKVVLIFEDLDRIDPAHLFRILNVLGANIDYQFNNIESCKPNKFGANNIITVFDYEVTQHIFHHFYGDKANYKGYISKFTTHNYFEYSIDKIGRDRLYKYLIDECNVNPVFLSKFKYPDYNGDSLNDIINKLSIRDIMQIFDNLDSQITNKIIEVNDIKFHSRTPLSKFIAIMRRMNINIHFNEVEGALLDNRIDLINFIGINLLTDAFFAYLPSMGFDNKFYNIDRKKDQSGYIIKLEFTQGIVGKKVDTGILKRILFTCFDEASSLVKY